VKGTVLNNQKNHCSWSSKHARNFPWVSSEHFQRKFLWMLSHYEMWVYGYDSWLYHHHSAKTVGPTSWVSNSALH